MFDDDKKVALYYCYELDNFLFSYPGDFFNPRWVGAPFRRMLMLDVKQFKRQIKNCHMRLIDKNFCKLDEFDILQS